jgi:hypothetical protein
VDDESSVLLEWRLQQNKIISEPQMPSMERTIGVEDQGCQVGCFQTKNANLLYFAGSCYGKS